MPRFNVCHDEKWACFSSIVDDFVTDFMPINEYEQWRTDEYGLNKTELEHANKMDVNEALETIKFRHGESRYSEVLNEIISNLE